MAISVNPREPVDADELSRREFAKHRKGFDPAEVRAHLLSMADELKRLQAVEADLRAQVARLEEKSQRAGEFDETNLAQMVGEETARVLEAARTAASEIRDKAEESGARLVREAQERATQLTTEAEELRLDAARESEELVSEAAAAAATLREESEEAARITTERANSLLEEKTAEAEQEAEEIRAASEALRVEVDAEVEALRVEAQEASRVAAEHAEVEAAAITEAAREHGRRMVHEAKEARERMLRDLAERRRTARQQLEALRAGQERMLEAFATARSSFDEATDALTDALPAAREAADEAARLIDLDAGLEDEILELDAELPGSDLGAFGPVDDDRPTAVTSAVSTTPFVADTSVPGVESTDDDGALDDGGDEQGVTLVEVTEIDVEIVMVEVVDDDEPSHLRLVSSGPGLAAIDDDLDDDDDDDDLDDEEAEVVALADDIFARLRADQVTDDNDDASGDAVVIDLILDDGGGTDDLSELAETDGPDVDLTDGDTSDGSTSDEESTLLDRRDAVLADLERSATRKLKRLLSDHENGVLDRARRSKKKVGRDELFGSAEEFAGLVRSALVEDLVEAVTSGTTFFSDEHHGRFADAGEIAGALGPQLDEWLAEPILDRLARVLAEGDPGPAARDELVASLRAAYRELKADQVPEIGVDLLTLAFNRGILASADPTAEHCWVVDHGGLPCPDGEDNHLAGATLAGEAFPTGDVTPPAHPGCRCLLAPAAQ